ncbi:triose-phosphate isomerase [Candidatus Nitrosotenuis sp. DW1]|uniref:triose-phosphate isomerase n=1 Tax=Candidatus Nitrosotenuis sp. DW1 TaxID=2259672 RepID=UPI0015CE8260|nr:triose-phosphate isomerase [Candidatus Nitrosotenuis sp. DW1]QLH09020.1 triose-phosphate isomerase [Candidatus Nitrosotenuis sp. DW1]
MFIINYKNYEEIAGDKAVKLASVASNIAKKYKIKIAIAPPHHLLSAVKNYSGPVLSQHVDNSKTGSTTGFVVPELLKKSNISGSLINHSEHRIPGKDIIELVERLQKLKMITVVCVKDVAEAAKYAKLNPTYIAIEPPELIGSGKAVSTEKPELITKAVKAVRDAKNSTKLLCGAGIVSGQDVRKAMDLGSNGILVASGIVKAKNWNAIVEEFAKGMLKTRSKR